MVLELFTEASSLKAANNHGSTMELSSTAKCTDMEGLCNMIKAAFTRENFNMESLMGLVSMSCCITRNKRMISLTRTLLSKAPGSLDQLSLIIRSLSRSGKKTNQFGNRDKLSYLKDIRTLKMRKLREKLNSIKRLLESARLGMTKEKMRDQRKESTNSQLKLISFLEC